MYVKDVLQYNVAPKFFILDSHQEAMKEQETGHRYDDNDYIGYHYNVHRFNQLVPGSYFLYRRPGKLSQNGKFVIYGGGVIDSINPIDADGNVIASVKLGFSFETPIIQGDPFIENFLWEIRQKPGPGWKGFWINYGMNEIKPADFWGLVDGRRCNLCSNEISDTQTVEENAAIKSELSVGGFTLTIAAGDSSVARNSQRQYSIVQKMDFEALSRRRKTLGTAGELLALEYENERLAAYGNGKVAEHVADTIGDGLGYDIRSYDCEGNEVHIEVKTTRLNACDNFFMSRKELEEAKDSRCKYMIYRIYRFNETEKTACLQIYNGADIEELFDLVPTTFRIRRK